MNSKILSHRRADRRRHQRFIKRLPGRIVFDNMSFLGITSDVSENGVFLRSSRSFVPETVLHIELTLADNKVSYLKGIVKRTANMSLSSSKSGMGIELVEKDDAFRTLVHSMNGNHATIPGKEILEEQSTPDRALFFRQSSQSEHSPAGEDIHEKRKYQRFRIQGTDFRCRLTCPSSVNILNISMDGIKLTMDKGFHIGRECLLNLQYKHRAMTVHGKVIWSFLSASRKDIRGNIVPVYSVGMQFSKGREEETKNLRHLVEEIARQDAYRPLGKGYIHSYRTK